MHKKQTKLRVDPFMTISGNFLANSINIFYKIELQAIILMCLTCLNLFWIKSYNIKHNYCHFLFLQFCKKNTENLWLIIGHFRTISGHCLANCMKIFHKKEVQTVILRCLVCLNLNWIKSYSLILVKIIFLSCLKMHHFMASLPKWVLTSPKETSSHIFKMVIFPKFLWAFIKHKIR